MLAIAPVFSYIADAAGRAATAPSAGQRAATPGSSTACGTCGKRHDLLLPIALMAVVGMIGFNFPVTLAALAKINFHAGPSSFGLLTTALAVGALGGALAGSGRRGRPGAYVVLGAALAFGVFEVAVGFAPNFVVAMILLVPTGFFSIYLAQARQPPGADGRGRARTGAG